jgi:hypothetical protein
MLTDNFVSCHTVAIHSYHSVKTGSFLPLRSSSRCIRINAASVPLMSPASLNLDPIILSVKPTVQFRLRASSRARSWITRSGVGWCFIVILFLPHHFFSTWSSLFTTTKSRALVVIIPFGTQKCCCSCCRCVVVVFVWLLLQYMRQETKVLRTKQISLDVLTVHDSQCRLLHFTHGSAVPLI